MSDLSAFLMMDVIGAALGALAGMLVHMAIVQIGRARAARRAVTQSGNMGGFVQRDIHGQVVRVFIP